MELKLIRKFFSGKSTIGYLMVDGRLECFTLEDMVREVKGIPVSSWKVPGKTAIPYGKYEVIIDFSQRFQKAMPHILSVEGFEGVRIHAGNFPEDTEGCILVGRKHSGDSISESTIAYRELFQKIKDALCKNDKVYLEITNPVADNDKII